MAQSAGHRGPIPEGVSSILTVCFPGGAGRDARMRSIEPAGTPPQSWRDGSERRAPTRAWFNGRISERHSEGAGSTPAVLSPADDRVHPRPPRVRPSGTGSTPPSSLRRRPGSSRLRGCVPPGRGRLRRPPMPDELGWMSTRFVTGRSWVQIPRQALADMAQSAGHRVSTPEVRVRFSLSASQGVLAVMHGCGPSNPRGRRRNAGVTARRDGHPGPECTKGASLSGREVVVGSIPTGSIRRRA